MLLAGEVGDDASAAVVLFEPHPGEHLAADGFVADPEDESAELLGLDDVGEREEISTDAFDVHARSIKRSGRCSSRVRLTLLFEFACRSGLLVGVFYCGGLFARFWLATAFLAWGFAWDWLEAGPAAGGSLCVGRLSA